MKCGFQKLWQKIVAVIIGVIALVVAGFFVYLFLIPAPKVKPAVLNAFHGDGEQLLNSSSFPVNKTLSIDMTSKVAPQVDFSGRWTIDHSLSVNLYDYFTAKGMVSYKRSAAMGNGVSMVATQKKTHIDYELDVKLLLFNKHMHRRFDFDITTQVPDTATEFDTTVSTAWIEGGRALQLFLEYTTNKGEKAVEHRFVYLVRDVDHPPPAKPNLYWTTCHLFIKGKKPMVVERVFKRIE
eukprot:224114_1